MRWIFIIMAMESFLWGGCCNYAGADIIGFQFSGSWTKVDSAFNSLVTEKHPVTGSVYYDTTITAAAGSNNNQAYYYGSDSHIINFSFSTDNTPVNIKKARIAVFDQSQTNTNSTSPMSEFQLWFNTKNGLRVGEEIKPASLPAEASGSFFIDDITKKFFTDDLLPRDINPLQAMSTKLFTLYLPTSSGQQEAVAEINSITPVPEPKTIILLCLGLTLIFFYPRPDNRKGGLQKLRA
ncbi:hypothetical protein ACOHYD_06550 [Desulfobacterota bacterium M19]